MLKLKRLNPLQEVGVVKHIFSTCARGDGRLNPLQEVGVVKRAEHQFDKLSDNES